jgi:hypothetical protein
MLAQAVHRGRPHKHCTTACFDPCRQFQNHLQMRAKVEKLLEKYFKIAMLDLENMQFA